MSWLVNNVPAVSSSIVAVLSIIISLLKLFNETDISSKKIKRFSAIVDIYNKIPSESTARKTMGEVVAVETDRFKKVLTRKVNKANVAIVIIISLLGGFVSYLLALWATNTSLFWSITAWILFGLVALLTIGIAITGLSEMYTPDKQKDNK